MWNNLELKYSKKKLFFINSDENKNMIILKWVEVDRVSLHSSILAQIHSSKGYHILNESTPIFLDFV